MNAAERYLRERWFATKGIGRLLMELTIAKKAYENAYGDVTLSCTWDEVKVKRQRKQLSPVEYSAVLVVDHYRAEAESIEKRLLSERLKASMIEQTVLEARLLPRELEYVRLRYFENRSATSVAQRMFLSPATCGRLRESALAKVEAVMEGDEYRNAADVTSI